MRRAIIKALKSELSKIEKPKTKSQVRKKFLQLINSGFFFNETLTKRIHVSRASLYNWEKRYKTGGVVALIPKYQYKSCVRSNLAFIKLFPTYKKIIITGPPRSRGGKSEFLTQLITQWSAPPIDNSPVILSLFFGIPIPKGTKMKRRTAMLDGKISHIGDPSLESLTRFAIDCLSEVVFESHHQLIRLHVEKEYQWYPQTLIYIRALKK